MTNPPIEVRRGKGWTTSLWEERLPVLARAAKKADQGIGALGIDYAAPKVATAHRVNSYEDCGFIGGMASRPIAFGINVMVVKGAKPHDVLRAAEWSSIMFHETVHCARMEYVGTSERISEAVATEGLAYLAGHKYILDFAGKQLVSRIMDSDLEPDQHLARRFGRLARSQAYRSPDMAPWLNGGGEASATIPPAALYGVQLVQQQLDRGYTLPELITLPSREALGI
ncbi:MAG: hypothetical protein JWN82_469 [Candidatus Saccharibacteria bacterium]|nr:hypothetical protein [Candidatus Saccharibacteria bacterium]